MRSPVVKAVGSLGILRSARQDLRHKDRRQDGGLPELIDWQREKRPSVSMIYWVLSGLCPPDRRARFRRGVLWCVIAVPQVAEGSEASWYIPHICKA